MGVGGEEEEEEDVEEEEEEEEEYDVEGRDVGKVEAGITRDSKYGGEEREKE